MQHKTFASLGLIKALADEGKDYIDLFIPFVKVVVSSFSLHEEIIDIKVKQGLLMEFGLEIPLHTVNFLLRKLSRTGYLQKKQGLYFTAKPANIKASFIERRDKIGDEQTTIIQKLQKFAKERYDFEWTEEETYIALLAYVDSYGIDSVRAYIRRNPLPILTGTPDHAWYIASMFLREMQVQDVVIFQKTIDLIKGSMIANSLLSRDIEAYKQKLRNSAFYFDTVLALRVLGYEGEEHKQAARDLVELLKAQEAKLYIFRHNLDEAIEILDSVEAALRKNSTISRPIFAHFYEMGAKPSDVILAKANLTLDLEAIGIRVSQTPRHIEAYQIDEEQLEAMITRIANYKRDIAIKRDVDSIRCIYTLRNGHCPTLLEEANAVFITTNDKLAKAARDYGKRFEQTKEVSAAVTDYEMTNIVWLKSPHKRANVIEHTVISNSLAALEIPEEMWNTIIEEADKLQQRGILSPQTYSFLLCSPQVREEIADATLGGNVAFKQKTLDQIIARAKEEFTEPLKRELEAKTQENLAVKSDLGVEQSITLRTVYILDRISFFISKGFSFILFVILFGMIVFASLSAVVEVINNSVGESSISVDNTYLSVLSTIISIIVNLILVYFGGSIREWQSRLDNYLARVLFTHLANLFNIPDERRQK